LQRTVLTTIGSALLLAGVAAMPAAASAAVTPTASPTTAREVLVVDDDGQNCPRADYHSVQAAVDAASPGALVRVCPGAYTEFVQIDKPLTLLGQPDEIDGLDCFDPSTSQAGDLDSTRYAIIDRPQGTPGNLVTVASGGVTVAGLVLQGATTASGPGVSIFDAAIQLQTESAGARVHHNLIRLNSLGIDLGSDGSVTSRVDHNCIRDNRWGVASQRQDFVGGTVDHNETFRQQIFGYGVGDVASTRDSVFADNVARQDLFGFSVTNASNVSIANNIVEPRSTGVLSGSGNTDFRITGNSISGGTGTGVAFSAPAGPTSQDALVAGNVISGFGRTRTAGSGIVIPSDVTGTVATVNGVEVANNVLSDNAVGLSVIITNPGIDVHDNTATHNRQYGIRARFGAPTAPRFGATFTNNTMLGNGQPPFDGVPNISDADAFDGTFQGDQSPNTWTGNVCEHDIPVGKICGVN